MHTVPNLQSIFTTLSAHITQRAIAWQRFVQQATCAWWPLAAPIGADCSVHRVNDKKGKNIKSELNDAELKVFLRFYFLQKTFLNVLLALCFTTSTTCIRYAVLKKAAVRHLKKKLFSLSTSSYSSRSFSYYFYCTRKQ